jgi:DedD protein
MIIMEKKKLLLLAVSTGVFLVIVIGAAILVFSPRNPVTAPAFIAAAPPPIPAGNPSAAPEVAAVTPVPVEPASLDVAELVKNTADVHGLASPSASSIQENNFYINSETPDQSFTVEKNEDAATTRLIINVPKPNIASAPAAAPAVAAKPRITVSPAPAAKPAQRSVAPDTAAKPAPAAKSTAPAAKSTAPAAKSTAPAAKSTAPVAKSTAPAAKSATPAAAKTYNVFWVQAGSFSTRVRADGVRETLAAKGINSVIENRDVNGQAYYRVRVGPYTSKNEADYWLSLIKSINGFEESQVWQSRSRQ